LGRKKQATAKQQQINRFVAKILLKPERQRVTARSLVEPAA